MSEKGLRIGRYRQIFEWSCYEQALKHDAIQPGNRDVLPNPWRCPECHARVNTYGHGESGLVLFAQEWFVVRDVKTNKKRLVVLAPHQIKIFREMTRREKLVPDPLPEAEGGGYRYGSFVYRFWIYSCPKKSGKSSVGGIIGAWAGITLGKFNEIYFAANSRDQATTRAFASASQIFLESKELRQKFKAQILKNEIRLDASHTSIRAAASDFGSMAGVNPGLVVWDELWVFSSEEDERLWQELAPSPARRDSITVVVTYAGFENESKLLWGLYLTAVSKEEHESGKGAKLWADLPVYTNGPIFCYWDHKPRMDWHTPKYLKEERLRTTGVTTWMRQYENRWTTSTNAFILPERYDACEVAGLSPLPARQGHEIAVGVDLGWKHDCAAVVAVWKDPDTLKTRLARYMIWRPPEGAILDIEATIEAFLLELHAGYRIKGVWYDPTQMVRSAQTLTVKGINMVELPQTDLNLTKASGLLYRAFSSGGIELYPAPDLREHVVSAVTVESPRGARLQKEKAANKIDACVALSFAMFGLDTEVSEFGFA